MLYKIVYIVLLASCVLSRNVPRFTDLDDDDQHLLRAAYDTPSYDHDEYQEEEDLPLGKLDLLKDGLWAVKAKLKELKAVNKALVANLLTTKLKVKELVSNSMALKKHHHVEVVKKPAYHYQAPSGGYSESQYAAHPQYAAQPQYGTQPQYAAQSQYGAQSASASQTQYTVQTQYEVHPPSPAPTQYAAHAPSSSTQYAVFPQSTAQYGAQPQYAAQPQNNVQPQYSEPQYTIQAEYTPQHPHDPYYGH